MKNIGVKVLIGLCVVLLAVIVAEAFIIRNKNEELKNNTAVISAKDERISELEKSEKSMTEYSEMLSSQLEVYQKAEKEKN